VELMLRHSFSLEGPADRLGAAIERVLVEGYATRDIAGVGSIVVGTAEMGDLVVERL